MGKSFITLLIAICLWSFNSIAQDIPKDGNPVIDDELFLGGGEDSGGGIRIDEDDLGIKDENSSLDDSYIYVNFNNEISSLDINFLCVAPIKHINDNQITLQYFKPQCSLQGCNFEYLVFEIYEDHTFNICSTAYSEDGYCESLENEMEIFQSEEGDFHFLTPTNEKKNLNLCFNIES